MPPAFYPTLFAAASLVACANASPRLLREAVTVPFELRGDFAIVEVAVNGIPTRLILDTGSGALVLDTAFARASNISMSRFQHGSANGSRRTPVLIGNADSVRIGPALLMGTRVAAVDFDAVRAGVGWDVHGALGYEFFDRYVVEVDYAQRILTLHEPAGYVYSGKGVVIPVSIERNLPVASATIRTRKGGDIQARLTMDLGTSGYSMKLASRFARVHKLTADTATVSGPFGAGVGGMSEGDLLRLPALKLGELAVERPSVALSRETEGAWGNSAANDGTIGAPIFKRARIIVDYARSRIIIEPGDGFGRPDSVDASGLYVTSTGGPGGLRITDVVTGSAAGKAGLLPGDMVVSVDGRAAQTLTVPEIRSLFREAGRNRRVVVRRGDRTIDIVFTLRQVI
jgi:PDZ domain/Aspartyl protease